MLNGNKEEKENGYIPQASIPHTKALRKFNYHQRWKDELKNLSSPLTPHPLILWIALWWGE